MTIHSTMLAPTMFSQSKTDKPTPRSSAKSNKSKNTQAIRAKGSKNCPSCFKKKVKCSHLQELCKKIGNHKTPMLGYSNRILFDGFKFHNKDRSKLDEIIIDQVNSFTKNLSAEACINPTVYRSELQSNFYEPIQKQFEKIAFEKVEIRDDISISSEEGSSSNNEVKSVITPQLSIADNILQTKSDNSMIKKHLEQTKQISKDKLVLLKLESNEMKSCYLSLESFSSLNQLRRTIELQCQIKPKDIKFDSNNRILTVCDGFLINFLKTKFSTAAPSELTLHCTI